MKITRSLTPPRHLWKRFLPFMALLLAVPAAARERALFYPEAIQAQISYLASDELRGRGSGDRGNDMAARFIAQEFARLGLKPLGTRRLGDANARMDGSGYFQPFMFRAPRIVGKGNLLEARFGGKKQRYRANQEYGPSGVSGAGEAEGEVVFVGYGIRAKETSHDDYAGVDVKGKIALLLAGNPSSQASLSRYADIRSKVMTARDLGAKAVLVILPKTSDTHGSEAFAFQDSANAGLPVMRARRTIAESWLRAAGNELSALETDADADKRVSFPTGAQARLIADVKQNDKVTANIAGLLEGSDPTLKNEVIVIGAHMDHLGMGGPGSLARSGKPAIHHGADDNASGTAGVLQLASYFRNGGESSPKRSLLFLCFSGEELGLLGSQHYVAHPLLPLEKTVAMLNMDMIGRLKDNKLIVSGIRTAKEWSGLIEEANKLTSFQFSHSDNSFGASDQESFYQKDIPVLFFFTGLHDDYHTPTDTAEKINIMGEARILQLVAACAESIANKPERPTFQKIPTRNAMTPRGRGVYFGTRPDYAADVEGVKLSGVSEGSPAEKAGLKAGDILIKLGDKTIRNIEEFQVALSQHKPGDVVEAVVKRGDQTLTFKVTLASRGG